MGSAGLNARCAAREGYSRDGITRLAALEVCVGSSQEHGAAEAGGEDVQTQVIGPGTFQELPLEKAFDAVAEWARRSSLQPTRPSSPPSR